MGESLGFRCRNCGAMENFMLGVGRLYFPIERIIPFLKGNTRRALADIVSTEKITHSEYEHCLFACPRCNTLHEHFYVKVEYGDDELFETYFRCGKCSTRLIQKNKPISQYYCDQCGHQALEEDSMNMIMWD